MRIREDTTTTRMKGYEILDFLYEKGPRTVEEIGNYTGLSHSQVIARLLAFMPQGYVAKVAEV